MRRNAVVFFALCAVACSPAVLFAQRNVLLASVDLLPASPRIAVFACHTNDRIGGPLTQTYHARRTLITVTIDGMVYKLANYDKDTISRIEQSADHRYEWKTMKNGVEITIAYRIGLTPDSDFGSSLITEVTLSNTIAIERSVQVSCAAAFNSANVRAFGNYIFSYDAIAGNSLFVVMALDNGFATRASSYRVANSATIFDAGSSRAAPNSFDIAYSLTLPGEEARAVTNTMAVMLPPYSDNNDFRTFIFAPRTLHTNDSAAVFVNNTGKEASDVEFTIQLPEGLRLSDALSPTIAIGNLDKNDVHVIGWEYYSTSAEPREATLTISGGGKRGGTGLAARAQMPVSIPAGTAVEPPPPPPLSDVEATVAALDDDPVLAPPKEEPLPVIPPAPPSAAERMRSALDDYNKTIAELFERLDETNEALAKGKTAPSPEPVIPEEQTEEDEQPLDDEAVDASEEQTPLETIDASAENARAAEADVEAGMEAEVEAETEASSEDA